MNWYFLQNGQRIGPVTESTFAILVKAGTVTGETLVWREGMAGWQPYASVRAAASPPPAGPARGAEAMAPVGSTPGEERASAGTADPAESAPGPDPGPSPRSLRFSFTGAGTEYFGIWIVNILLMIVTLGIYTAWAKVRRKRYFYGTTQLDGTPFEYRAGPIPILKGWLIAAGLALGYSLGSRIHPAVGPALLIVFAAVTPWLVVRSRIFNARNSSWRNIRFGFRPRYREAYLVFLGLTLLVPATLGILYPYADYRRRKFLVENSSYGDTPFTFHGRVRDFYVVYLKAAALVLAAILGGSILVGGTLGASRYGTSVRWGFAFPALGAAIYLLFAAGFYIIGVFVRTSLINLTFNATRLGELRFLCSLQAKKMIGLHVSNAVAVIFSLGLFVPWARTRVARYRCERLAAETPEGLDRFRAAEGPEVGAAGEEISDLFDIDIAI